MKVLARVDGVPWLVAVPPEGGLEERWYEPPSAAMVKTVTIPKLAELAQRQKLRLLWNLNTLNASYSLWKPKLVNGS